MKKFTPVIFLLVFMLAGCSLFNGGDTKKPLDDSQMATRVAQLLQTMTTPTTEIEFPATPTVSLPTVIVPPAATATPVIITATPIPIILTDTPTPQATNSVVPTILLATATNTPTGPTATPGPTATVPAGDPINYLGNPTGIDNLDSAAQWVWPTGEDQYLKVGFSNGSMQMTGLTNLAGWRLPLVGQQVNSYIELTTKTGSCSGKDSYGLIFRIPVFKDPVQGYLFQVTCDGYYRLWKWDGKVNPNGLATVLVPWKQSSAIVVGANQTNRLGVKVVDKTITIYINGVQQASATDATFTAGFFGVFVRSAGTTNYTVNFDTVKYWENPK